ncbi:MAG: 4Fe-4S dicluster domain-containing protein [Deltaproteobacteria bacterium]|nr:4Fe-4S dicluster domain-containing protein [Deltaproteobacteria bacterium]
MPDQTGSEGNGSVNNRRRAGVAGLFTARIKSMLCVGCGECLAVCKYGVLRRTSDGKVEAKIGQKCLGCHKCIAVCRTKAIQILPGIGFSRTR